jgi:hypothetical protein
MSYGTGRIEGIINQLECDHGKPISLIDAKVKLEALCDSLKMLNPAFDQMIIENSPIFRTIKGHVFESVFDHLLQVNNVPVTEVGGDDAVDRIVNKKTLQLKTCTVAGTKGDVVQYKNHKTHGSKSEKQSIDYYDKFCNYPDFLVGLISYDPLNIIVLSKDELPRHPDSNDHLLSPFTVDWSDHKGLNAFDRFGVNTKKFKYEIPKDLIEVLPLTAKKIGISSNIILNTILNKANFRIWDLSIRGIAKEVVFKNYLSSHSIPMYQPCNLRSDRTDKADIALIINTKNVFLQIKGISTNNCDLDSLDSIIAVETQLTRGQVNDHQTHSRLYLKTDFDYLVLGLDPPVVNACIKASNTEQRSNWEFYLIPTDKLEAHKEMGHRIKSIQKFNYSDLQQYKITDWSKQLS